LVVVVIVVAGTIAPSRDLPELSAEDTIRIILSNLNLVVPVVAALLVIIIAIIVICILRSKGNHHKGIYDEKLIKNFVLFSVSLYFSLNNTKLKKHTLHLRLIKKKKKKILLVLPAHIPQFVVVYDPSKLHVRIWFV